jgi:hypothetical protein
MRPTLSGHWRPASGSSRISPHWPGRDLPHCRTGPSSHGLRPQARTGGRAAHFACSQAMAETRLVARSGIWAMPKMSMQEKLIYGYSYEVPSPDAPGGRATATKWRLAQSADASPSPVPRDTQPGSAVGTSPDKPGAQHRRRAERASHARRFWCEFPATVADGRRSAEVAHNTTKAANTGLTGPKSLYRWTHVHPE